MGLIFRLVILPVGVRLGVAVGLALTVIYGSPQLGNTPLEAAIVLPLYALWTLGNHLGRYRKVRSIPQPPTSRYTPTYR